MIARLYRGLQYLSIDISLGAVILLRFFSSGSEEFPNWQTQLLLGLVVWMIYTVDHLRDAKRAKGDLRPRYQFHLKYESSLRILLVVAFLVCMALVWFLPPKLILAGGVLFSFCVLYVLFQARLAARGVKEIYVALLYTSGVLLAPLIQGDINAFHFFGLFFVSLINLVSFSWIESEQDLSNGFQSIGTRLGTNRVESFLLLLIAAGLAFAISGWMSQGAYAFYFTLAPVIFSALVLNRRWSEKYDRYRTIGDGVFMLPILMELL